MKATESNLLTLLKAPNQFLIPIYQRTYNWTKVQCQQLLSDILGVNKDPSMQGHFIGSVVYFQESIHTISDIKQMMVIDGQQRLTTISLLIAALSDFLKENKDIEIDTSYSKLQNYYLFNSQEENELRYKLMLTKKDKDTYINLIKGIEQSENHSIRIVENYNFFRGKINSNNAAQTYNGIQRLYIVEVALEKDRDNPQLIFESMNSTGLDLSQADLIRNYILMSKGMDEQKELYEKYWYPMEQSYGNDYTSLFNKFVRDYLIAKTGSIPNKDNVYEAFKNYANNTSIEAITNVVKDIYRFSKYYVNMVIHKEPDVTLKECFKRISQLKIDVCYPYLLPIYNDYDDKVITINEFIEIVEIVENYVFRRAICSIPTNSLNKTFETLYRKVNKDKYLESVKASFLLLDSYKRFPNDSEFENNLEIRDIYNLRTRNYMLNKLENYNRKEHININDYTIEHIMPQNSNLRKEWIQMLGDNWQEIHKKYLHTLGNLTLTAYNSELSDRSFEYKKTIEGGFNDSPLRLNEYLRTVDKWDKEEIEKRAKRLAEKAQDVWAIPCLTDDALSAYIPKYTMTTNYTIDSYDHLTGYMLELYQELRKRILNISPIVREEFKKLYIAFKVESNFVDIVPQKSRLRLSLNMPFNEIIDPKGLCKDISSIGRWGNGDVEVGISNFEELDDVIELIQQACERQID